MLLQKNHKFSYPNIIDKLINQRERADTAKFALVSILYIIRKQLIS